MKNIIKIFSLLLFFNFGHSMNLKVLKKISLPVLIEVNKVICDRKENFYILSSKENIVLKIDKNGKILDSIIKGEGYEIKKGKFLTDMVYDEKEKSIFIYDFILKRVSQIGEDGKFINNFLIEELTCNMEICADTIFMRVLKEIEKIDSLNYTAFLFTKIHKKNGNFLCNAGKGVINKKIEAFFSMPFAIDPEKKLIYMIFPPNKIEIRKFNGDFVKELTKNNWIFLCDLFLLKNRYLLVSSFSESKKCYIVPEVVNLWKGLSVNEIVKEEITKRNLFKIQKEPPMVYEEVSYAIDIFDIEKNNFLLEDYLPFGKLVGAKDKKIFFVKGDTLLVSEFEK